MNNSSNMVIRYCPEPTPLQCGQAVLAMLGGRTVEEIVDLIKTERETTLRQMFAALDAMEIPYSRVRVPVKQKEQLPAVALLSLETPRCWHWSLFANGRFYDPEHGILDDFPPSNRRYYWEIHPKSIAKKPVDVVY